MSNVRKLLVILCLLVAAYIICNLLIYVMTDIFTEEVYEPTEPEVRKICKEVKKDFLFEDNKYNKVVYFVTPTHPRPEQIAELTRLSQTLKHVQNLHWILADDTEKCSPLVTDLLLYSDLSFTYMISPMPGMFRKVTYVPRGVSNRRAAIEWIKKTAMNGVLYFGDDDNTYDLRIFDEVRSTVKVSMFPVGLIGDYAVSSPVVNRGRIVGFYDSWIAERQFPVDMAGFAVAVPFLISRNGSMPYKAGHEEDLFLKSLGISNSDIEPKAEGCTKIYVWHTRTAVNKVKAINPTSYKSTNIGALQTEVIQQGMGKMKKGFL